MSRALGLWKTPLWIIYTEWANTHTNRLCRLDSYEAVVSFLPTNIAKSSVVRDVFGDVGDLVDRMVVLENLQEGTTEQI